MLALHVRSMTRLDKGRRRSVLVLQRRVEAKVKVRVFRFLPARVSRLPSWRIWSLMVDSLGPSRVVGRLAVGLVRLGGHVGSIHLHDGLKGDGVGVEWDWLLRE